MTDTATKFKGRSPIPTSAYKVLAFALTSVLLLGILASLIGNISLASARTYYAYFTDATGVNKGDRVRISGVEVGAVKGLQLVPADGRTLARVEFTVKEGVPLYRNAELQLRYENVVGQRYLSISEIANSGEKMPEDGTFPVEQTTPALNLTQLFNGFQPLFRALDPDRVNAFSFELVRAFQGESGSMAQLMRHTASLTHTLADRDQVIGRVVGNLNTLLETVAERDDELGALLVQFRDLMVGLSHGRGTLNRALPSLASLLESSSGMLGDIRPPLAGTVTSMRTLAGQVYDTRDALDASLKRLPVRLNVLARTASYGTWFNFYVCGLGVQLGLGNGTVNFSTPAVAADERETVCGLGADG
ncbi:MCE family protein [Nocardioides antri]|uniref:MCE family protein n=1 Tax=Nocardioides antri TaxID=2607659 RepID=A0A5B1M7G4_9ACTN|nr:MCE family protein [Nocardioides antri]KAA1427817.1 MCE family protein [Nocardioides antri]